jgi:hypothetical protein
MLVCLGGLAFAAAQVTRMEWLASGVDLLLLVPFAFLAWQTVRETPAELERAA